MATSETFRGFIALPLPEDALQAALALQDELKCGARRLENPPRWSGRAQMHVTLKFFGQIERAAVPLIGEALDAAVKDAPAGTTLGPLDAFPNPSRARVVVALIFDPEAFLSQLATALEDAGEALGVERERRPFRAHVTLARLKPPTDVRQLLESVRASPTPVQFERACLFESELTPTGPRYTVLHEARFSE